MIKKDDHRVAATDEFMLRRADFSLSEVQEALQAAFRTLFENRCPTERVRAAEPLGWDPTREPPAQLDAGRDAPGPDRPPVVHPQGHVGDDVVDEGQAGEPGRVFHGRPP